jgi:hypothetical protein
MSIQIVNNSTLPADLPKVAPKQTNLDKGVAWAKENTQDGTFVGDHYMLAGAGALVGTTAAVAGVAKLADKVPAIEKAVEFVFEKNGKLLGGSASLGAAYVLGEDAVASFKEGSTAKGAAETLGATVAGLGGAELVGRQFNIPVVKEAISGPARFVKDNVLAVSGGAAAAGGLALGAKGVKDIKDGKAIQGAVELTAASVGVLGGGELIGRQYNIPVLNQALSGPFKAVFGNNGMSKVVGGGAAGLVGAGVAVDGARRLTQDKGLINDGLGALEVTAGVTGITGGTSLIGMGLGNERLARVLPENLKVVAGVGMVAGATALAKHTVKDMKENGVGLINTATGTGAALLAVGGTQQVAENFGIPVLNRAMDKAWKPVLGAGLAVASYQFGANALKEGQNFLDDPTAGKAFNAGGQAVLATLSGAGSATLLGGAMGIPALENAGEKVLRSVGDNIVAPVFKAAVKNPFLTLGAVAVAGGAGYYIYSQNKDK